MDNSTRAANAADVRTDPETGLPSRIALEEDVRRRLAEAQRHGNRLSLVLIKVGSLRELMARPQETKHILVLRACTQFFAAAVREMDLVARFDLDVFGIELPGAALLNAVTIAKRLKAQIESCPLQLMDAKLTFRINIGAAEAQPGEDVTSLVARAEAALAASVASIGDHVHTHNGISIETTAPHAPAGAALAAR